MDTTAWNAVGMLAATRRCLGSASACARPKFTACAGGRSKRRAEDAVEAGAYLGLRFRKESIEGGKIGHVRRPCKQSHEARRGRTGVERSRQAEAQDLCEIIIEPYCGAQDLGVLGREYAQPPGLLEHARGRCVENVGRRGRVNKLQVLGDELDVD